MPAALFLSILTGALLWSAAGRLRTGEPRIYLWAWERPEQLEEADPAQIGIAYLAGTIRLSGGSVISEWRRQPLSVAPGAQATAVVRIETDHAHAPLLDSAQQHAIAGTLGSLAARHGLRELQIDFDATTGQREFYRAVLSELRNARPKLRLSITALVSWCLADDWIHDLPVDEAVPMLFRMGPETSAVRARLDQGRDFAEPLCRHSYGLSLDEAVPRLPERRRTYWFNPQPWTRDEINKVAKRW